MFKGTQEWVVIDNEYNYNTFHVLNANLSEEDYNKQLISKSREMLEMLQKNEMILQNTLSYLRNLSSFTPRNEIQKINTNIDLIKHHLDITNQLIKEATEL